MVSEHLRTFNCLRVCFQKTAEALVSHSIHPLTLSLKYPSSIYKTLIKFKNDYALHQKSKINLITPTITITVFKEFKIAFSCLL